MAAQLDVCHLVTSEMDTLANQTLRATVDVEQEFGPDFIVTMLRNGWCRFRLSHWPILQLVGAQVSSAGASPPSWVTVPAADLLTEHSPLPVYGTIVPSGAGPGPTAALIPPGYVSWANGRKGYLVQVTSINGFPTCGIDRAAVAGATTVHVDDITGWWSTTLSLGARGVIMDGPWRETLTVTGVTPDTTGAISGPGTLTLDTALQFNHSPGEGSTTTPNTPILFTAMPGALTLAAQYLSVHYAISRGASAAVMQSGRGASATPAPGQDWYGMAEKIVAKYARVF